MNSSKRNKQDANDFKLLMPEIKVKISLLVLVAVVRVLQGADWTQCGWHRFEYLYGSVLR
jgi:hypothetical protein